MKLSQVKDKIDNYFDNLRQDELVEHLKDLGYEFEECKWFSEENFKSQNKTWIRESQKIAIKIIESLKAQDMTVIELGDKLNFSDSLSETIIGGSFDFRLSTISKIENILNIKLL